ncbi:MAG: hypothetical protein H6622_17725 [Halobacteriovoraceae bacterium]|nr:hypothetical protein [Halobacteriovoraceae bacterium]
MVKFILLLCLISTGAQSHVSCEIELTKNEEIAIGMLKSLGGVRMAFMHKKMSGKQHNIIVVGLNTISKKDLKKNGLSEQMFVNLDSLLENWNEQAYSMISLRDDRTSHLSKTINSSDININNFNVITLQGELTKFKEEISRSKRIYNVASDIFKFGLPLLPLGVLSLTDIHPGISTAIVASLAYASIKATSPRLKKNRITNTTGQYFPIFMETNIKKIFERIYEVINNSEKPILILVEDTYNLDSIVVEELLMRGFDHYK